VLSRASVHIESRRLAAYRFAEDPFPPLARGRTRRVYPYAMQDDLSDEREEREFTTAAIDNGLLRVTVLPELGGHVLSARDLVHERELFFNNLPLKFGLIGLRGAWWAGGVEFNFPQIGHNVSTSDRVSWHVREDGDGSATVFVGGIERLTRMAWTVALTLRAEDWRLHTRIRIYNRTPFVHRTYFWSNAAVPARPDFRLLLPTTEVFSFWYGAVGSAAFPIDGGRDKSRLEAFDHAADTFAKDLRADWFGCYYEEQDCGVLHHASRFEVPGRKLFTWGSGSDGELWAKLLSDSGQPYVELQSGRFVHQGIQRLAPPGSVEQWEEAWFPVWGLGGVVHTTGELAVNATRDGDTLGVRLLALVPVEGRAVRVAQDGQVLAQAELALGAGEGHLLEATLGSRAPVQLELGGEMVTLDVKGEAVRAVLDGTPAHTGAVDKSAKEAEPTTPGGWLLKARGREERNDLDGAADSYRKVLELDPCCAAAMAGLAQWHLNRGETGRGVEQADRALAADPLHADALWWLGVAGIVGEEAGRDATPSLAALGRSPSHAAGAAALLGETALRRGSFREALAQFARALELNPHDSRTWALAAFAATKAGDFDEAVRLLDHCEREDPLEPLLWSERVFLGAITHQPTAEAIARVFGTDPQTYLDVACDYERIGAWEAAAQWLSSVDSTHPMVLYHAAYAVGQMGKAEAAGALARQAAAQSPLFVAPHRHEDEQALRHAVRLCPEDALAHYLLGTRLAAIGRWDEALAEWRRAVELAGPGETAVLGWRNLGVGEWHHGRAEEALAAYGCALETLGDVPASPLADAGWRLWLERDRILAHEKRHAERMAGFESAPEPVRARWQVAIAWADAALGAGQPDRAATLLASCTFKPWEGEGRSRRLWKQAHMQLGHAAREAGRFADARDHYEAAAQYPRHLGIGRPTATDDADALFWAGSCALELGDREAARQLLSLAANERQSRKAQNGEFKARAADLLATLGG